jgi:hypothetical protein
MVPQIDFLPASYHQQRQREHKTAWRRMLLLFFLAIAVLGVVQQRRIRQKLEARRDELQTKAEGLRSAVPDQTQLNRRLKELETRTLLLTSLQLRVPMTQTLAAITGSLPEMVSLNDLQAEVGTIESTTQRPATLESPAANKGQLQPFEEDLAALQRANAQAGVLVMLSGIAPDDLAISQYLITLRESELFERITLVYSGPHTVREEQWRSFQIRLQVKHPLSWLERSVDRRVARQRASDQSGRIAR